MSSTQNQNMVIVEIDADIQSIVPDFLENRKKDCLHIAGLLDRGAYSEIRTLGHRMKGAGGSYGFDEISDIGEQIEHAALAGDQESIDCAVKELSSYLTRLSVVYV